MLLPPDAIIWNRRVLPRVKRVALLVRGAVRALASVSDAVAPCWSAALRAGAGVNRSVAVSALGCVSVEWKCFVHDSIP